jgi:hypothetical protein
VPDHLRGKDPTEAVAKLWGALDPMIKANSERGAKVESVDGFKWTPPEKFTALVGDQAKDPFIKAAQSAALSANMTDKQYQSFMSQMSEALAASQTELGGGFEPETNQTIKDGNYAWIDNLKAQGRMTPAALDALDMLTASKGGSEVIALLQQAITPGFAVAPGSGGAGGGFGAIPTNLAEANKLVADPRYMTDSPKFDPAFRKFADDQKMKFVSGA